MLHFLFCLGLASSSRLFKCLQYCLFIYTLTTLFVYAAIVDDVDDAYHALSGGCLDFTENRFFTVKRESAFNKLFNPNGQTDGILFVYKYDEHSHNIYHQMNWYLSHFHDIISSPALLSSLQRRSQCNHQPFTIHILFPHGHHLGYQWAVKLLESYPINMRWNGIQCFSEISIQCHFYTISSAEIDPQFIRKDDVRNLLERHSIPNCIKLNCRWPTLMEYRHSDWIIAHQPHYQWIAEWTAHYKSMYHINGRDAKLSNHSNDSNAPRKWKIGFIQRPEKRRYLRDLDTKMDLFQALSQRLDSTVFEVERILMHHLDPLDQARAIDRADILIGAHGAGMTNLIFMKPFRGQNERIRPAIIEIGLRFGWCQNSDLFSGKRLERPLSHNDHNEELLDRWSECGQTFYKKSEFFALCFAAWRPDEMRYLEVNAAEYGQDLSHNFIEKETVFVNATFLIGEIQHIVDDSEYDFKAQKEKYKESVYGKDGMEFPGEGRNTWMRIKVMQSILCLISMMAMLIWRGKSCFLKKNDGLKQRD